MKSLIPVLVALNVVFASIGVPIFIAGVGLGSGGGGSSFDIKTVLAKPGNERQLKAASLIFKNSCDEKVWEEAQTGFPYPADEEKLKNIITAKVDTPAGRISWVKDQAIAGFPCKANKNGKAGVVFQGGNGLEIAHLLLNHWDVRVLETVTYLIVKRYDIGKNPLTDSAIDPRTSLLANRALAATSEQNEPDAEKVGYQAKCDFGKKSAPFLTLHVTAGYMDLSGQPTALARAGEADDPAVKVAGRTRKIISPSGKGKGIKIYSAGCTVIKQGDDIKQVIPNSIALGQEERPDQTAPGPESAAEMASVSDFADPEIMGPATNEAYEDNPSLITAGLDEAQRQAVGAVLVAEDVVDPDVMPEIIPFDIDAITAAAELKKTTYIEKAAQIAEQVIEKQKQLPIGFFRSGNNLAQMGRATLFNQTGKMLGEKPTSEEISKLTEYLSRLSNPEYSAGIPPKAIELFKKGKTDDALSLIALNRLKKQFDTGWTDAQMDAKLSSGISPQELNELLKNRGAFSDPQEDQMLASLISGGYPGLAQTLQKLQEKSDQTVSGSLVKVLREIPQLSNEQVSALKDFKESKYRESRATDLENLEAPKALIDWLKTNKTIKSEDEKTIISIIDQYTSSPGGRERMRNLQGDIATNIIQSAVKLMKPDEQQVFTSLFGANPTADELKAALSKGTFDRAAEATWMARTFELAGADKSTAVNMAVNLSSGKGNPFEAGVKLFNTQFGSLGVTFSGKDFQITTSGIFSGAKKLAMGLLAKKGKISFGDVWDAITGRDRAKKAKLVSALNSSSRLTSNVKSMLDESISQNLSGATSFTDLNARIGAGAKAASLSAAISSGPADQIISLRGDNARTLEQAFSQRIDNTVTSALGADSFEQLAARSRLTNAGLSPSASANIVSRGAFQGSTQEAAVSHAAETLSLDGLGSKDRLAGAIGNKLSVAETTAVANEMSTTLSLRQNVDLGSDPVGIMNGMDDSHKQARAALLSNVGEQVSANSMVEAANERNIPGVTKESARTYIGEDGSFRAAESGTSVDAEMAAETRQHKEAYDAAIQDGTLEVKPKADQGKDFLEEFLGFKPDLESMWQRVKDMPQNILDTYSTKGLQNALSGIGAGVIVNTLIGNKLAEIDPTGGVLTQFAMNYAAHFITTLGISMPILLGIAFILNPKATLEAIKGMVMMIFNFFKDPIGTILSLFGLGKKPKAAATVTNAENKTRDTVSKSPTEYVGPPPGDPSYPSSDTAFAQKALAAADNQAEQTQNSPPKQATSDYLSPKKPTRSQLEKISRRTTDQLVEDLLLAGEATSPNKNLVKDDPEFVYNHWTRYMGELPLGVSFTFKQLISPRAPVPKDKQDQARQKGVRDFLYEKEPSEGMVGLDFTIDLSRLVFGKDTLPVLNEGRKTGFGISSNVYQYVYVGF